MTPLQIEILLHYYCHGNDYRDGDFSAPAVREAIDVFKEIKMLEQDTDPRSPRTYRATPRCNYYVEYLCRIPLPEQSWTITPPTAGVDERRCGWKGGVPGSWYEMKPGETPADTLLRMQREGAFT